MKSFSQIKFSALCLSLLLAACNASDEPINSWVHSNQGSMDASFSADGQSALVATLDKGTLYWDLLNNNVLYSFSHKSNEKTLHRLVKIAKDAPRAITVDDTSIAVWDTQSGESLQFWQLPATPLDIDITQDGRFALVGFSDNKARIIDLQTGVTWRTFEHADKVNAVAISNSEKFVVIGSDDTAARLWNLETGEMLKQWFLPFKITKVAISTNEQYVLISSAQNKSEIYQVENGEKVSEITLKHKWIPNFFNAPLTISAAHFSSDGEKLFTGSPPRHIRQWDVKTGNLEYIWTIPKRFFMKPMPAVSLSITTDLNNTLLIQASNGMGYQYAIKSSQ